MSKKIIFLSAILTIIIPLTVRAKNRSYYYDKIDATIIVNSDSTLSVEERQTYNYTGKYTVGWRSISLDKLGSVTDVEVYDGETKKGLERANVRPVTDTSLPSPSDYGKYATFKKNGHQNIEWYYNMENTTHMWILKYKVHGAIEFGKDSDRLYYNIFTDYDVSVKNSQVIVLMPTDTGLSVGAYRAQTKKIEQKINGREIMFSSTDFAPREALTIDLIFPKNIVTKTAFWKDWLKSNYGYLGSAIVIFLSILIALIRWIVTEVLPKGRGTIVPQYAPPQNLPPAMAQIIVNEKVTPKSWVSTLIDLAVRGYVKIEEDKKKSIGANISILLAGLFVCIIAGLVINGIYQSGKMSSTAITYIILAFALWTAFVLVKLKKGGAIGLFNQEYIVTKIKPFAEDKSLREYEKKYLSALFTGSDTFSTREMKKGRGSSRNTQTQKDLREAKKLLLDEIDAKTEAFANKLSKEKYLGFALVALFMVVWGGGFVCAKMGEIGLPVQPILLFLVAVLCAIVLILFFKYEARLSQKGREMKEEWLGFKMYLEVAEKYRMQNLTPDLFEKYLPYAMIFNVEKKWAKNFEAMHLPAPEWYHSAMIAGALTGPSSVSSFSPSGFSSSFLSSFSSSFSSSGGGGGGGGGSAGGGGGGGGGGAR